ncbi:MAG: type IV pilin N-terminal domain-containing protein [Methanoregula sp.]|nr:type IV pilin N-terminal domain-containing protein [Methanoregula sp.]
MMNLHNTHNADAVSPVIGVMLMLVVVIIIAAIVSAFGGGLVSSQPKTPQATIKATFSVADGMTIRHAGGDAIPYNNLVFIIKTGPGFGPNTESVSTQNINTNLITDQDGNPVFSTGQITGKTAFKPGDTLFISAENSTCYPLQPVISEALIGPSRGNTKCSPWWNPVTNPTTYNGGCGAFWQLCFRNPKNVGKVFILQTSDKAGNLISRNEVKITP